MPGRRYSRSRRSNYETHFTKMAGFPDPWAVLEHDLKRFVDYGNYDYRKSIIPMYDTIYKYLDDLQKSRDYEKNTGRIPAYGSSSYTFGSASDLVGPLAGTAKNAVYAVGNLSKRF